MENYNNDNSAKRSLMSNNNSAKQPLTEKHIDDLEKISFTYGES